ncbi:Trp biosynthesis-associated membrane protein [Microbacterium sp. Marseille-Q6965]|uniref:Trp biosynthesis-associated membrane protein n=1 Tax=Microbacterium sp. Marseille-Q6965 TaxID=2965072 RepID=UPI0021B76E72|nr:Trp biosynthesis-associated membrane protein [Microbacterium sp. Marseille-Q6965]
MRTARRSDGWATRRGRSVSVLLVLAGGATLLIGSTQTWLSAELAETTLPVPGAAASPVLQPLALAALALSLVLALAGRALRYVLGTLAAVLGVLLIATIAPIVFAPPVSAVASTVTEHTGLAGEQAVGELVVSIHATAWPAFSLLSSALVVLGGIVVVVTAARWRRTGRRYETATAGPAEGPLDAIDSWDDLSHGQDPTAR